MFSFFIEFTIPCFINFQALLFILPDPSIINANCVKSETGTADSTFTVISSISVDPTVIFPTSQIFNAGLKVPNGFVITTKAYETYVEGKKLNDKINEILNSEIRCSDKSTKLKALFNSDDFPETLTKQVEEELVNFSNSNFAVRSSYTFEDLPGMSFAGQYNTFLNVSKSDLIEKIVECWQSL